MPGPRPWRDSADGVVIDVRLTPKAAQDAVEGVERHGEQVVLRARVRALPDKGQANAALEKLIATWLGVPGSMVALRSGKKSRLKQVAVAGDPGKLAAAIERSIGELE